MKLREILRLEIGMQGRRLSTWVLAVALLLLMLRITLEVYVPNARTGGYFFNSPFVVVAITVLGSVLGLLVPAALAGEAGARDLQTRMHPLVYTTPIRKGSYLGGRFLAAFLLHALILLVLPAALLLSTLSSRVEPELLGPFLPDAYAGAYLLLALPNAFVATAILFSLAVVSRRAMSSYLGGVLLFFIAIFGWLFLAQGMGMWGVAKLLDPFGLVAIAELSRSWTAAEKNTVLPALEGWLLANRFLWMAVAAGALALTHRRFRFAHHLPRGWRRGSGATAPAVPSAERARASTFARSGPIEVPRVPRAFGLPTHLRQTAAVAGDSFREIVAGWGGLVLAALTAVVVLTGPSLMRHMGVPLRPTTASVVDFLGSNSDIVWLLVPLLIVFYAGELVWREREAGLAEISDAVPAPDWVPLLGRVLGLWLVLLLLQLLLIAAGIALQASLGYHRFEPGLYLRVMLGLRLPDLLLFALLAVVVHVVVNQKYVAHLVAIGAYALAAFGSALGLENHLLVYGSGPEWSHSDMAGFGGTVGPWLWHRAYWAAWALLLALGARLLWVRGREGGTRGRLALARRRFSAPVARTAAVGVGLVLLLGGFIFHRTHAADHPSAEEWAERRVAYELRYGRFRGAVQPLLTATSLGVEIDPERREVEIRGSYRLVNASGTPIDSLHLTLPAELELTREALDRPATRVLADEELGYRIHVLETPLQPGDSLRLDFALRYHPRGSSLEGLGPTVLPNGTQIASEVWLPAVGYQPSREIGGAGERRARGLPAPAGGLSPEEVEVADHQEVSERVALEVVVGTTLGQTAVAPGRLVRGWTEGDRAYFHYATDHPIRNDYTIFSAAYALHEDRWVDPATGGGRAVAIQIFHHPSHAWNLETMTRGVKASLASFGRRFGAYPHGQIRLVEHPGDGSGLHAAPVNIQYEEGFPLFDPESDPRGIDFPFAVIAHEVAHQWWGNQLTPAYAEGAPLLTESLAWYSVFSVVEESHGADHLRRFLAMMREAYLDPRSRAAVPLLRADSWFLAYRKGAYAMYALREYLGEARIDAALRRLLERHPGGTPPLPTSLDLYRELQAVTPDSLRYLLTDLFEENTYWELAARSAAAEPVGDGRWRVSLELSARKVVVDSAGVETERAMDDLVEVGVFAAGADGAAGEPLYLRLHRMRAGEQRITVTVSGEPSRAGVDPRNLLIDVEPHDNVTVVRRR